MSGGEAASEFGAEGEGDEELPLPFVWQDGRIDFNYPVGILDCIDPEVSCQIILISRLEGELLVAVPFQAWHRLRAQRTLPVNGLSKVTSAEVALSEPEDRMSVSTENLKIWLGFLRQDLLAGVHFPSEEEDIEDHVMLFQAGSTESYLAAEALVDVARDHFAFFTVEEGEPGPPVQPLPIPGAESGSQELSSRVQALETTMADMSAGIQTLLKRLPGAHSSVPEAKAPPIRRPQKPRRQ